MFTNVVVKNKLTGKLLETEKDGLYITFSVEADGSIEIEDIGTCVDNSTLMEQDTQEKSLNPNDFELITVEVINSKCGCCEASQ